MADWDPEANELFLQVLEITDPEERRRFLDAACAAGPIRRGRVDGLLRASEQAGSFLGCPAAFPEVTGTYTPAAGLPAGPGTTIGPYKLVEAIGEGGMGTVRRPRPPGRTAAAAATGARMAAPRSCRKPTAPGSRSMPLTRRRRHCGRYAL